MDDDIQFIYEVKKQPTNHSFDHFVGKQRRDQLAATTGTRVHQRKQVHQDRTFQVIQQPLDLRKVREKQDQNTNNQVARRRTYGAEYFNQRDYHDGNKRERGRFIRGHAPYPGYQTDRVSFTPASTRVEPDWNGGFETDPQSMRSGLSENYQSQTYYDRLTDRQYFTHQPRSGYQRSEDWRRPPPPPSISTSKATGEKEVVINEELHHTNRNGLVTSADLIQQPRSSYERNEDRRKFRVPPPPLISTSKDTGEKEVVIYEELPRTNRYGSSYEKNEECRIFTVPPPPLASTPKSTGAKEVASVKDDFQSKNRYGLLTSPDSLTDGSEKKLTIQETNNNDDLTVAEFKSVGVIVTLGSIKRLSSGKLINDDLIDFGIYFILQNLDNVIYIRASAWQLYMFRNNTTNHHNNMLFKIATKWGRDFNLLTKRFIVIPVNRNSHWFVAIICNPFPPEDDVRAAEDAINKGHDPLPVSNNLYKQWINHPTNPPMVFVLDSKYELLRKKHMNLLHYHASTTMYAIKGLKNLHQKYWEKGGSELRVCEEVFRVDDKETPVHIRFHSLRVPSQLSGNDCGMYCFQFVKHWFHNMENNNQNYMSMVNKDCTNWFTPKSLIRLRPTIYFKILHQCQLQFPNAMQLLKQANPSTIPPHLIKLEPQH
ncbi:unnamed protein product [Orchesella dallaii]|uniref:Ubiquitin-like protease family profile domain-containing protein n=1 Tax=Orchesella dallaii TaxID=48710 RepID=A0ABP1Q6U4_9HEXA